MALRIRKEQMCTFFQFRARFCSVKLHHFMRASNAAWRQRNRALMKLRLCLQMRKVFCIEAATFRKKRENRFY